MTLIFFGSQIILKPVEEENTLYLAIGECDELLHLKS